MSRQEPPKKQKDLKILEPQDYPREVNQKNLFVVQEHHATRLHWDLRLERNGVLKSWAIPKGLPLEVGVKRLAIQVEDHPLDYATFEGTIPTGEYGAGTVKIWDSGVYEVDTVSDEKIMVTFHGDKLKEAYVLIKTRLRENSWLLFKMK